MIRTGFVTRKIWGIEELGSGELVNPRNYGQRFTFYKACYYPVFEKGAIHNGSCQGQKKERRVFIC
jgi:hypothetical protein